MSKLMELVEDYGILRYRLACIGERNHADLAARADERKEEIRTRLEALERDAARYQWLRDKDSQVCGVLDKVVGELPSGSPIYEYQYGEELDSRIDAAMEAANVPER